MVVYKRTGEDLSIPKVDKPAITPVSVNREDQSDFLVSLTNDKVKNINPVFLNFDEDVKKTNVGDVNLIYKANTENERFKLKYIVDMGTDINPKLKIAVDYIKFLGTDAMSASELQQELYKLGSDMNISCNSESVTMSLSGLQSNFDSSVKLFENVLSSVIADEEALTNLKLSKIKSRSDAKLNKQVILWSAMVNYAKYGSKSSFTSVLSEEELNNVNSEELVDIINGLTTNTHRILYYGPEEINIVSSKLYELHTNNKDLKSINKTEDFIELPLIEPVVYVVDYDMKQAEVLLLAKGSKLNIQDLPLVAFHNSYFGGGMSSIVFQEMRESKALAYSVYSTYSIPKDLNRSHYSFSYIGTQSDKMSDALVGMTDLLENMPTSEENMMNSRNSIEQKIRTERITKSKILSSYENAKKIGINYDIRESIYNAVRGYDMTSLIDFHKSHISGKNRIVMVLGDKENLDLDVLRKYGELKFLSLDDIFGY